MLKLALSALFFVASTLISPLWAQDNAAYVSRLTATPGSTSVMLTWKDAEGYPGAQYEVWRSAKEILKDTLPQSKLLGTVNAGVEAFEDTTVTEPSFYLVLLKDSGGNRKGYYIPFRNKTTVAVKPDKSAEGTAAQVKIGAFGYAPPQVLVTFQAFPPDRKLAVYRRASPILTAADLKDATLLGTTTGAQSPFKDTPAPGLDFYYAVVDAQAVADGRPDAFQPAANTAGPAGFPLVDIPDSVKESALDNSLRPDVAGGTRALPLPMLQVSTEPDSGAPLVDPAYEPVQPVPLDSKTDLALKTWSKTTSPAGTALPDPEILPEERSGTKDGVGKYLVEIQKAYLTPRDWAGAAKALDEVLKLTMDKRTEARARFYSGESKAFLKDYKGAFMDFLDAREFYPGETAPFIDALFSLL